MPNKAHQAPETKIAEINRDILRHIDRANNVDWNNVVPLAINYGRCRATGMMVKEFADELLEAGLIKQTADGIYGLNIEARSLTKEDVEAHIRKIEQYCIEKKHIAELRGERLYLTDSLNPEHKDRYASYDRNLRVMGFWVHSVCVITHQCTGEHKGDLILAERHPLIIETKNDSKWDPLSGAISAGATAFETLVSEGFDEYGLSEQQMRRARPLTTVTTQRVCSENPFHIVRERVQVSKLGLTGKEFKRLECHDVKDVVVPHGEGTRKMGVTSNVNFVRVSPAKVIEHLHKRKHLKNGKALSMLSYLLHAGHITAAHSCEPDMRQALARKPKIYCRATKGWKLRAHMPVRGAMRHLPRAESRLAA
ncbi:MAG: hypothetical protein SFW65_10420 [Alphaproteobacteria bacterium]|nr:hypothetical protein [Alphaproteobacteria bacterium]